MRKKKVFFIIICLLLLGTVQITVDYIQEIKSTQKVLEIAKPTSYCIFIEIEDKTLYLLQDGKCIKKYPIASGKSGWPSPLGYWKIINKDDWGEGFGGRWIGLNVLWATCEVGIQPFSLNLL